MSTVMLQGGWHWHKRVPYAYGTNVLHHLRRKGMCLGKGEPYALGRGMVATQLLALDECCCYMLWLLLFDLLEPRGSDESRFPDIHKGDYW